MAIKKIILPVFTLIIALQTYAQKNSDKVLEATFNRIEDQVEMFKEHIDYQRYLVREYNQPFQRKIGYNLIKIRTDSFETVHDEISDLLDLLAGEYRFLKGKDHGRDEFIETLREQNNDLRVRLTKQVLEVGKLEEKIAMLEAKVKAKSDSSIMCRIVVFGTPYVGEGKTKEIARMRALDKCRGKFHQVQCEGQSCEWSEE